ncbi:24150_t:CDS:2, partial [Gigaspora rosea]
AFYPVLQYNKQFVSPIHKRLQLRIVYSTPTEAKVDEISEFNRFPQEFW